VNVNLLIDAIVRQTTVLIAELATNRGLRAPLAHVAEQVFFELTRELDAQGVSRKVSADMFGMALRTYQRKVRRGEESATERGRSLWEAVYDFVRSSPVTTRRQVLERFRHDDEEVVRGVLADLVESNLVFSTGSTQNTSFRAASDADLSALGHTAETAPNHELLWALVFRLGPVSLEQLASLGRFTGEQIADELQQLVDSGRVERLDGDVVRYRAKHFFVSLGTPTGWEAAVFDHFHAVVRTICTKLRRSADPSVADVIGGSTYSFEVWDGHPLAGEVLGTLRRFRDASTTLRERVRAHNDAHPKPAHRTGVVIYAGQTVWDLEEGEE
jgi:hypothetical protein